MSAATPAAGPDAHALFAPILASAIGDVRAAAERVLATASGGGRDGEAVHDFRVALRRLRTALRPARRVYGKRLRGPEAELREVARASGALRDEEVLHETLATLELRPTWRTAVDRWLRARRPQERRRRAALATLIRGTATLAPRPPGAPPPAPPLPPIAHTLAVLEASLLPRRRVRSAAEIARASLALARREVEALRVVDPRDVRRLHALRIRFKRLRYTGELFAELHEPGAADLAVAASRMQKRLGDVHDLDQAVGRVANARGLPPRARAAVIEALRAVRARKIARALEELAGFPGLTA